MTRHLALLATVSLLLTACTPERDSNKHNDDNDALTFDGETLSLRDGGGTLSVNLWSLEEDGDPDWQNELIDQVVLVGTNLEITEGLDNLFQVDLSPLVHDALADPDTDPANELQTLSYDSDARELSVSGGNSVMLPAPALALSGDGTVSIEGGNSVRMKGFRNTIVVDADGGDAAAGASLLAALAGIAAPGAGNRWLVRLEPGTYDLGGADLPLRSFVDLEGSGPEATTIRSARPQEVLSGAANVEVRELTVENPAASNAIGIAHGAGTLRLRNVHVKALAGASSLGVVVLGGEVVADACEIESAGSGITVALGVARFHHGRIAAAGPALDPVNGQILLAHSQVTSGSAGSGSPACVGAFDANYAALGATCE